MRGAETHDAGEIAQRLLDRLSDDDGRVFGRVMEVDMQVALRADFQVDHGMAAEALEHVVEEADARIDIAIARPVEVERDGNLGLARLAFDGGSAHGPNLRVLSVVDTKR